MCDQISDSCKYRFHEILESIDFIEQWSRDVSSSDDFMTSPDNVMRFNACVMRLQVIGEDVGKLLKAIPGILNQHDEIPWVAIYDMRNLISHEYSNIDEELVFETIKNDLRPLKETILIILKD